MRSGLIPYASCAPPGAHLNPVTTSSKIRRIPLADVISLTDAKNSSPIGTIPNDDPVGSTITAAISSSLAITDLISEMSCGDTKITLDAILSKTPAVAVPSKWFA